MAYDYKIFLMPNGVYCVNITKTCLDNTCFAFAAKQFKSFGVADRWAQDNVEKLNFTDEEVMLKNALYLLDN